MPELFRKSALETLNAPEQLDKTLKLVPLRGWVALLAIGLILVAVAWWSVVGNVTRTVSANGYIMPLGGSAHVLAPSTGVVAELPDLRANQRVTRGELVGRIARPALRARLDGARKAVAALRKQAKAGAPDPRLADAEARLGQLEAEYAAATEIRSQVDGYVVDADTHVGAPIRKFQPVWGLYRGDPRTPYVYAFMRPGVGTKSVRPGMRVEIVPFDVNVLQTGYLWGVVARVGQYPLSPLQMHAIFGYASTGSIIDEHGVYFLLLIRIEKDPRSPDGFHWSSQGGSHAPVAAGTFCRVHVILAEDRPIATLIPALSRHRPQ